MRLEVKLKGLALILALITAPIFVSAQSMEEAQKAYNAGVTAKTDGNIQEAITQFTTCVETCEILVEEEEEGAEDLMYTVQAVIPGLYLKLGADQIQNKQVSEGLENLYKGREVADMYGDSDSKEKAEKYIAKVHYKLGASKYKSGDYAAAHAELDKCLEVKPDYVGAYYLKTVVYKKEGNDEGLKASATKGIEVAKAKNDTKNANKIANLAHGHFLKKGNEAKSASNLDEAVTYLNTALEFDATDATTLYLLSATYLAKGDNDNAITTGETAVLNEGGGEEAQAKIYMIIAEAQTNKGDTSSACATYKKAAVGQYAELANYKIEHELKCE